MTGLLFPIKSADIALLAFYHPIFGFWPRQTKVFRFKTVSQADGQLRFEAQPPGDVMKQYNATLAGVHKYTAGVPKF